ncbi:MAG: ABC transporter substrate binding protein [Thauera sp.]
MKVVSAWRRRALGALLLIHALLAASIARAQVVVVADPSSPSHAEAVDSLVAALAPPVDVRVLTAADADARALATAQLVVTVGSQAARNIAPQPIPVPVLHVLLPRSTLDALERRPGAGPWSALLLDQPAERQIALIRLAFPDQKRIATVTGPDTHERAAELGAAAARHGLEAHAVAAAEVGALYPALREALAQRGVLVIPPDSQLFTSQTVHQVLLTAFRLRSPVLGYSAAYVRAGAVLGLYTTPAQVGTEAAAVVRRALTGTPLPAPGPHRLFEVGINPTVAHALGIELPSAKWLTEALQGQEGIAQ